jgi:outer membrane lipoprotein carrier protein
MMHPRRRGTAFLLLGCIHAALLWLGAQHADAQSLSLGEIIASYEKAKKELQSLQSSFTQTKILTIFEEKEDAQGLFLYKKPGRVIWQFTAPGQSKTVINNKDAWAVFPGIKQIQKSRMDASDARRILSVIGFDDGGAALSGLFDISLLNRQEPFIALRLVPVDQKISPFFSEIELFLDPGDFLPRRIVMHETSKDLLIFRFHDLKKNVELQDSLFEFSVPEGFEVLNY